MKLTKEQACQMIRENEGRSYDWRHYSIENGWDIEDLIDYKNSLEKCEDGDYSCVMYDIDERITSCGFDMETRCDIEDAIFDLYDQAFLAGELNLDEYLK